MEHYLDDFIVLSQPAYQTWLRDWYVLITTCNELEVPFAGHNLLGPCTKLVFLGIEIDTVTGHLRLPSEKLHCLRTMFAWVDGSQGLYEKGTHITDWQPEPCMYKVVKPCRSFPRARSGPSKIKFLCDNKSVVAVMKSRTSRNPHFMHLSRCLFFIEASMISSACSCAHVPGKSNDLADDLLLIERMTCCWTWAWTGFVPSWTAWYVSSVERA